MKIKPTTYAQLLVASLKDKPDFKELAKRLWHMLQKNKQYKELPKILSELEKSYAAKQGYRIAEVESGKELSEKEKTEIKKKLTSLCHSEQREESQSTERKETLHSVQDDKLILKTKINPNVIGIKARMDQKIIDLTIENKVNRLKKSITV